MKEGNLIQYKKLVNNKSSIKFKVLQKSVDDGDNLMDRIQF